MQRDAYEPKIEARLDLKLYGADRCQRVDPALRRMLKEKFKVAESFLGRFIGNILKHFTDERNVQGVRGATLSCSSSSSCLSDVHLNA